VELLTLTLGFDTQRLTGAAPAWAGWLGYAPVGPEVAKVEILAK
jgi:hypothetical protein